MMQLPWAEEALNLETAVDRLNRSEKPVFIAISQLLRVHQMGESATNVIAQF